MVEFIYLTLTLSSRRGNPPLLLQEKGPGVEVSVCDGQVPKHLLQLAFYWCHLCERPSFFNTKFENCLA
jgi:hypothetical protein